MIATVLAAVGVTPALSATERRAHVAKEQSSIKNGCDADVRALREQCSAVAAKADAASAKVEADADAFELKLSEKLASDFRSVVVPLLKKYREQPSRKIATAVRAAIRAADADAQHQLGVEHLDHVLICSAFASTLVEESPDLVSVFASIESYHNGPISSATQLLHASESDFITGFESAIEALEASIEHVAKTAPRSTASDEHHASFEALTRHATSAHRAHAVQELSHKHGHARDAKRAAEYRRPHVVHQEATGSRVEYDAPIVTGGEDDAVQNVERGHFSHLPQVDFTRLEQP